MTTKIADLTKTSRWLKGSACKTVLGSALFVSASLLSGQASAYADFGIIGLTEDPTEFPTYVSPSESIDFTTYSAGNYGGSEVFSGNGYSVTATSNTLSYDGSTTTWNFTPASSLTVISPGGLSTQDPGKAILFTADVGNPSGMGGTMKLVDGSGNTTSGFVLFTIGMFIPGSPTNPQFYNYPIAFDATTGFDFGSVVGTLPNSFYLGGFLEQAAYNISPLFYYAGFGLTPLDQIIDVNGTHYVPSTSLYAVVENASVGASTLYKASGVPEIDALAGTSALSLIGIATLLTGERRRRRV